MTNSPRPWVLAETNYGAIRERGFEVAVLPCGATEPHNLHLPYGTDSLQVEELAERACAAAWERGSRVVRLPVIPYGTETNLREFPLAMNPNPSTLLLILRDLLGSLAQSGIHKLLILNGHGGNDFKPMLRELYGQTPVHLFLCDWFRGLTADVQREIFESPGDHAGEMETAFIMAYFPHLVAQDAATGALQADDGALRPTQLEAVNQGWVNMTRPWHLLTTNTGAGNPHAATAEKGRRLMEVMVPRLSNFLVDVARLPANETFPY